MPKCTSSASRICRPMVSTGLSEVIGSWKIIAISRPRIVAQLLVVEREQVAAAEHRRALRDAAVPGEDPEQRERGDALAAARLADDPERLAGGDVERDAVDGVDEPSLGAELDVQVVDDEERLSSHGLAASGRAPRGARRRSG